jgi:hypothetical protein
LSEPPAAKLTANAIDTLYVERERVALVSDFFVRRAYQRTSGRIMPASCGHDISGTLPSNNPVAWPALMS